MKSKTISVIVLNYNGLKFIEKCLSSILNQNYSNIEVIFVDDASKDDSVNFVASKYPQVRIIKNKVGLGFGAGNLAGVKAAKGKRILLVNNDTWMEPDLIANLNKYFDSHRFSVIAPYQADYNGDILPIDTSLIDPLGHHIYVKNAKIAPFYLTGVCIFCERNFYLKTRGMDPKFFLYIEDADWFWRLILFGFTFSYVPKTYIYHKGGGSTGGHDTKKLKPDIFMFRNRNTLYMLLQNYSVTSLLIVLPTYFFVNLIEIFFFVFSANYQIAKVYITSWVEVMKNIKTILRERDWIQSKRVISDVAIFKRMYMGSAKIIHFVHFYMNKSPKYEKNNI